MFSEKINEYIHIAENIFGTQYQQQDIDNILDALEKGKNISLENA